MTMEDFVMDEWLRTEVRDYCLRHFEKVAVQTVFERGDTSHLADAKDVIEDAFDHMESDFMPKKAGKEPINEAR